MLARLENSNRQGNKLSSERDDRYVKAKAEREAEKKKSKAKGERKGEAFQGGGEPGGARWPSQGSHDDAYDSRATPFERRTPKCLRRTLKRQHAASAILATEP